MWLPIFSIIIVLSSAECRMIIVDLISFPDHRMHFAICGLGTRLDQARRRLSILQNVLSYCGRVSTSLRLH